MIPSIKMGKALRFRPDDVNAWLLQLSRGEAA